MKNKAIKTVALTMYSMSIVFTLIPIISLFLSGHLKEVRAIDINRVVLALKTSLGCSVMAMVVIILLGTGSAYFMTKYDFKGKVVLDQLFSIPMLLPPAVIGLLLLITFGRNGVIGKLLASKGIQLTFTPVAVIVVLIFVGLPVFINGVVESLKLVDKELELSAMIEGCSAYQAFRYITLPIAKSGILNAFLVAWSRTLAEFGATMMFAGNIEGKTQTMPLAIYTAMESNTSEAVVLALIMLMIALTLMMLINTVGKR